MKQLYAWLVFLFLPFSLRAADGDSLLSNKLGSTGVKFETALLADLSHTGYSSSVITFVKSGKLAFGLGPKIVLNRMYVIREAPAGLVSGIYYFPNGEAHRFSPFINADYQLTFNNDAAVPMFEKPGSIVHEYTAGYGFRVRLDQNFKLVSSVNIGRYTEILSNASSSQRSSYSGFNTVVRFGVNYSFRP